MTEAIEAVTKRLQEVKNQIQSLESTMEKDEARKQANVKSMAQLRDRLRALEEAIEKLRHV
jgi:chromosome segregation ATPase